MTHCHHLPEALRPIRCSFFGASVLMQAEGKILRATESNLARGAPGRCRGVGGGACTFPRSIKTISERKALITALIVASRAAGTHRWKTGRTPRVNEPLECSICRDAVKRMTSMFPRIVVVLIVHDRVRRRAYTPSHSIHDLGHRQVYMSSTCIIALAY